MPPGLSQGPELVNVATGAKITAGTVISGLLTTPVVLAVSNLRTRGTTPFGEFRLYMQKSANGALSSANDTLRVCTFNGTANALSARIDLPLMPDDTAPYNWFTPPSGVAEDTNFGLIIPVSTLQPYVGLYIASTSDVTAFTFTEAPTYLSH